MIITYNDDQQGYPHPDHLRVHDISVLAFDRAGDPAWYPEAGRAVPAVEAVLHDVEPAAAGRDPRGADARTTASRRTTPTGSSAPTTTTASRPASRSAGSCGRAPRRCWRTPPRSIPTEPFWFGLSDDQLAEIYPYEDWILARSNVGPIPESRHRVRPVRRRAESVDESRAVSVQYRVVVGKKDERVDGPDDADIVFTVPVEIARAAGLRRHRRVHARQGQGRRSHAARCSTC